MYQNVKCEHPPSLGIPLLKSEKYLNYIMQGLQQIFTVPIEKKKFEKNIF